MQGGAQGAGAEGRGEALRRGRRQGGGHDLGAAGAVGDEGHVGAADLAHLPHPFGLVRDLEAGHQVGEGGEVLHHRHDHRVIEVIPLLPDALPLPVVAAQGGLHQGPVREVLAGGLRLVGAGDYLGIGVEEDGEVVLEIVPPLVEQVEDGAGVALVRGLGDVGGEVRLGGEQPRHQPELPEALVAEGLLGRGAALQRFEGRAAGDPPQHHRGHRHRAAHQQGDEQRGDQEDPGLQRQAGAAASGFRSGHVATGSRTVPVY